MNSYIALCLFECLVKSKPYTYELRTDRIAEALSTYVARVDTFMKAKMQTKVMGIARYYTYVLTYVPMPCLVLFVPGPLTFPAAHHAMLPNLS